MVTDHTHLLMQSHLFLGLGGNLAAVQASRISTFLHRGGGSPGGTPPGPQYKWKGICGTFWSSTLESSSFPFLVCNLGLSLVLFSRSSC